LAVSANENRIKILATDYGLQLLQTSENCSGDASQVLSETLRKVSIFNLLPPNAFSFVQLVINPITVGASAGVADAGHPMVSNHGIIYLRLMFHLIQHNHTISMMCLNSISFYVIMILEYVLPP